MKLLPLRIITVLLLILEVGKQIASFDGGYNMYSLPFHYCSLFLYLLPFHSFYNGKYKKNFDSAAFGCLASLFLFMIAIPAVVYGEGAIKSFTDNFMEFHTVAFHNLVCLYFLITVALGLYTFEPRRDLSVMAVFLAGYVIIATVLSHTLEVNFHNLYRCNIEFIEQVRLKLVESIGWCGQAIYTVVLFILTILFAYAAYFLTKLIVSIIDKNTKRKTA